MKYLHKFINEKLTLYHHVDEKLTLNKQTELFPTINKDIINAYKSSKDNDFIYNGVYIQIDKTEFSSNFNEDQINTLLSTIGIIIDNNEVLKGRKIIWDDHGEPQDKGVKTHFWVEEKDNLLKKHHNPVMHCIQILCANIDDQKILTGEGVWSEYIMYATTWTRLKRWKAAVEQRKESDEIKKFIGTKDKPWNI